MRLRRRGFDGERSAEPRSDFGERSGFDLSAQPKVEPSNAERWAGEPERKITDTFTQHTLRAGIISIAEGSRAEGSKPRKSTNYKDKGSAAKQG